MHKTGFLSYLKSRSTPYASKPAYVIDFLPRHPSINLNAPIHSHFTQGIYHHHPTAYS